MQYIFKIFYFENKQENAKLPQEVKNFVVACNKYKKCFIFDIKQEKECIILDLLFDNEKQYNEFTQELTDIIDNRSWTIAIFQRIDIK